MLAKQAAELTLLFLGENCVPVVLISFRDRFLALASAIVGGTSVRIFAVLNLADLRFG